MSASAEYFNTEVQHSVGEAQRYYALALKVRDKPACEYILHTVFNKPRFGTEIGEIISQSTEGKLHLSPGSIYPHLNFLEKNGMIRPFKIEKDIKVRGRHGRKYYEITELGRSILSTLEDIRVNLSKLSTSLL